ncbi:hypothetical protein BDZ91DRAFT_789514 [Kalaharituber pfeilii]|nr:hypothetical protein BDZ91DRAFT_789514 [Kalaharituber pfeilii]
MISSPPETLLGPSVLESHPSDTDIQQSATDSQPSETDSPNGNVMSSDPDVSHLYPSVSAPAEREDDEEVRAERVRRIRRMLSRRRAAGWANQTGYFSGKRGPTLIHRTDWHEIRNIRNSPDSGNTADDVEEYDPRSDRESRGSPSLQLGQAISAANMTRHLLSRGIGVKDIKDVWNEMELWQKDFKLEDLIEWLCDMGRFNIASRILEAVFQDFDPISVGQSFSEIIYGNLALLAIPKDAYWVNFRENQALRLLKLLRVIFKAHEPGSPAKIQFSTVQKTQFVAFHLCRNLPPQELPELYNFLVECHVEFRIFTILHFIDRLAREGDYYKGYIIIQCLQKEGLQASALKAHLCRKAYTLLLSKATRAGNQEDSTAILKSMLAVGLDADTAVYNVLMYNAIQNGRLESALNIYRKLLQDGHKPNTITFTILFHLHKRTGNILEQRKVLQNALEAEQTLSLYMGTDIVHAATLEAPKGKKLQSALEAYQKMFRPAVLVPLGFLAPSKTSDKDKMEPDNATVMVVLTAFIQDQEHFGIIWSLYRRYLELRDSKEWKNYFDLDPTISNLFMYGLGRDIRTLDLSLQVMQDLLSPPKVRWMLKPAPNGYSWSTLAKCFAMHGRMDDAKMVVRVMQIRGYEPTEVTWNDLVRGYLREGRTYEAGELLGGMVRQGMSPLFNLRSQILEVRGDPEFSRGFDLGWAGIGELELDIPKERAFTEEADREQWGPSLMAEAARRSDEERAENVGIEEPVDQIPPVHVEGHWRGIEGIRQQERRKFMEQLRQREREEALVREMRREFESQGRSPQKEVYQQEMEAAREWLEEDKQKRLRERWERRQLNSGDEDWSPMTEGDGDMQEGEEPNPWKDSEKYREWQEKWCEVELGDEVQENGESYTGNDQAPKQKPDS